MGSVALHGVGEPSMGSTSFPWGQWHPVGLMGTQWGQQRALGSMMLYVVSGCLVGSAVLMRLVAIL